MVDANVQTEPSLPATVVGIEQDILIGERVRKSFGSRAFWGSVVSCYWISGGLFYKVSFDDGDVDIFSFDEVLQDVTAAKQHAKENPQVLEKGPSANETAVDDYFMAMRHSNLKIKRDDVVHTTAFRTRRVHLWGQRLYASIYTNTQNETFIREMLKTDDGKMGEMEATGQVEVGDIILAVNETRVLGMTSRELAELIRQPKRPITLTFYRPQHSGMSMQLQEKQGGQIQAPAASSALTTTQTPQIQQNSMQAHSVPSTQNAATIPRQQSAASAYALMPSSFGIPRPTFSQPSSMARNIAGQWIQRSSMSQIHGLSAKEIVRQRLSQNAAARQANYMHGHPTGMFDRGGVVYVGEGPSIHGSMYQPHQIQIMQSVANASAVRLTSGVTAPAAQPAMPLNIAPRGQFESNQEPNQRQHTGPLALEQVQQTKAVFGLSGHVGPSASAEASAGANGFSVVSHVEPEQRVILAQPERAQQDALTTSQQTSNKELTSDHNSAVSTLRESLIYTDTSVSSAPTIDTSVVTTPDAEAIAKLAEKNPKAAAEAIARLAEKNCKATERAMSSSTRMSSLLSPNHTAEEEMEDTTSASASADKDQVATKRETARASDSMSFLSPNDFNVESSMLSHRDLSTRITANTSFVEVKSNVSLVTVSVSRRRLYLTLGVQGTLIAVTSFVLDEFGRPGEVEASGKVFLGDVLVRVNETFISPGLTPSHVANIVNRMHRPMTLIFQRASWDILDGKA